MAGFIKRRDFLLGGTAALASTAALAQSITPQIGGGIGQGFDGGLAGAGGPRISLSNATIAAGSAVGTTIGTLSVSGGTGTYTFTLTSNPGSLFSISGSNLQVAGTLVAGSDPIIIQANNGAGSIKSQPFTITVTGALANGPMDFSVPGNIAITAAL